MRLTISAVVFSLILALAGAAQAHRVAVFAYVEGDQIKGEGAFSTGGKVVNQKVQVLDASGKVLAEGTTGEDSTFSLPLPKAKAPLTVVLDAGAGHRATFELTAQDLGQEASGATEQAATVATPTAAPSAAAAPTAQDLAPEIKKAVQQAVAPIRAQLAEMALKADEVSLRDIVGGIGWIVGLLGLAAYLKARKMAAGVSR